jgi:hypothetical protein
MKISGTLNYRVLKGMAMISSKDSTRTVINYVQVRRVAGETYWIATDGRRAGILHDNGGLELVDCGDTLTFELPVPKFALFGLRDKAGKNLLRFDMDTEAVPEHEEISPCYKIKGTVPASGWCDWSANGITQRVLMPKVSKYPDVMQVVPYEPFAPVEMLSFNPEFVLDAVMVMNMAFGVKCQAATTLMQYKTPEAANIKNAGLIFVRVNDSFYYVVMPMRTDGDATSYGVPSWMKNLKPVKAPAPARVANPAPVEPAKVATPEPPKSV